MNNILLIPYMMIASRMAGGGLGAQHFPKAIPEVFFCLPFGYIGYEQYGGIGALSFFIWAFLSHNTGHGTAFAMGTNPSVAQSGRKQFLSHVVDPICKLFKKPLGESFYCWLFMGLKGLWIGSAIATGYGYLLGYLWPMSYYLGFKLGNKHGEVEYFSGLCLGLLLYFSRLLGS